MQQYSTIVGSDTGLLQLTLATQGEEEVTDLSLQTIAYLLVNHLNNRNLDITALQFTISEADSEALFTQGMNQAKTLQHKSIRIPNV